MDDYDYSKEIAHLVKRILIEDMAFKRLLIHGKDRGELLLPYLTHENREVRYLIARCFHHGNYIGHIPEVTILKLIADKEHKELGLLGTPVVETLLACLKNEKLKLSSLMTVIRALGLSGDNRAVEPLLEFLEKSNILIQIVVIEALGQLQANRAVKPIIALFPQSTMQIQTVIISSIVQMEDIQAIDALFNLATNSDNSFIHLLHLLDLLKHFGDSQMIVEYLIHKLDSADTFQCHHIISTLGDIGDERAVEAIVSKLDDFSMWWVFTISQIAEFALERIATPKALAALEAWRKQNKQV